MLGIGLGPGFHWPNILLAIFLGTAVHMLLRWMASGSGRRLPRARSMVRQQHERRLEPAAADAACSPFLSLGCSTRGIAPGRHLCRAYRVAQSSGAELRSWVDVLRTCWRFDTSLIMG